jgi:hypothetical protein
LPNEDALPTAGAFAKSSDEIFSCQMEFTTKLGPQISLSPVPNFGVNNTSSSRRMGRSRGPESTASAVQRRQQRCCRAVAAASARPLARGAPAADEQLQRSCPSLSSLLILVSCRQRGGGAQCGASGEGRVRPNLQVVSRRWGWCGPTCRHGGSAGRTAKGQNHGVERCAYAFFRGRD